MNQSSNNNSAVGVDPEQKAGTIHKPNLEHLPVYNQEHLPGLSASRGDNP